MSISSTMSGVVQRVDNSTGTVKRNQTNDSVNDRMTVLYWLSASVE